MHFPPYAYQHKIRCQKDSIAYQHCQNQLIGRKKYGKIVAQYHIQDAAEYKHRHERSHCLHNELYDIVRLFHKGSGNRSFTSQHQHCYSNQNRNKNNLQRIPLGKGRKKVSRYNIQNHLKQLGKIKHPALSRLQGKKRHKCRTGGQRQQKGHQHKTANHPFPNPAHSSHIPNTVNPPCNRKEHHRPCNRR